MGISRSATVVCAYLVATCAIQAHEAIDFVISKRSIVSPNLGFRLQLETYAERFSQAVDGAKTRTTRSVSRRRLANVSEGIAERIRKLTTRSSDQADKRGIPSEAGRKQSDVTEEPTS